MFVNAVVDAEKNVVAGAVGGCGRTSCVEWVWTEEGMESLMCVHGKGEYGLLFIG